MSKTASILVTIAVIVVLCAAAALTGLVSFHVGGGAKQAKFVNKGVLEAICDAEISKPGDKLVPPFDVTHTTLPVIFSFDDGTGAYPGEYTISMNRKGTLKVDGDMLEIYRPAMFKRHGVVIIGEHLTLDRSSGQMKQWLDLEGDQRLELISASCRRSDKRPF